MPLSGEYEPGTSTWSRKHVEEYEATDGEKAGELRGRPVIVLTSLGAQSGKLRKTALMRVELDGTYAVVASLGGSPHNPKWYYNLAKNPHVELQDGAIKRDYLAHEATGDEKAVWWARAVGVGPVRGGPASLPSGAIRRPPRGSAASWCASRGAALA